MRDPPHPAPAEGGTGSVGLPMDVTPQRDARRRISACYCAPSRSHPVNGSLLHAPAHLPLVEGGGNPSLVHPFTRSLVIYASLAGSDQLGHAVERRQAFQAFRQVAKRKMQVFLFRGAAPFEQQAQRGGIHLGDCGKIDHEIVFTQLLLAGLAQRRDAGDGERATHAQLVTVAFDHFPGDCWSSVLFLLASVAISPSMLDFWISLLKVLR